MMMPLFSRRTLALMTTAFFVTVGAAAAFTTPATSRTAFHIGTRQRQADFPTTTTTTTTTTTRLNLMPLPPHDVIQSTSQWLADAATAAATDPAAVPSLGWWGQYINLFKVSLEFVHGAIEQPLKSIGIEQTWGPAIGLFTMCTYVVIVVVIVGNFDCWTDCSSWIVELISVMYMRVIFLTGTQLSNCNFSGISSHPRLVDSYFHSTKSVGRIHESVKAVH